MSEQNPQSAPPYTTLAEVYNRAGLAAYAAELVPHIIEYLQSHNWAGRRVIDLGCGTGVTSWWMAQRTMRVVGIDASAAMLAQAETQPDTIASQFEPPMFVHMDMRELESPIGAVDLVLALGGVLNYIPSLRELDRTFARVHDALEMGQFFLFDLHTIRGLSGCDTRLDTLVYDDFKELAITRRSRFSFETLSTTHTYTIWQRLNKYWLRSDETHVLRGFPTQGVIGLLERTGFTVPAVLSPSLDQIDPAHDASDRVVILAAKARE